MMDVLFEDNHLLVVNKPAGILTEPSGTEQINLLDQAKEYIKEKYNKPGQVFLGIVHRLDKPVSGIVVFARTSKALTRLNQQMREKKYTKVYTALVENCPPNMSGDLEHYLVHDDFKATISSKNDKNAKYCKLSYRVIEKNKSTSLLEIILETGRYHQIRAQFAAIGCPVVGDYKYGAKTFLPSREAIALHHTKLTLLHPIGLEEIVITAPCEFR